MIIIRMSAVTQNASELSTLVIIWKSHLLLPLSFYRENQVSMNADLNLSIAF
jgi:hypothetical protein